MSIIVKNVVKTYGKQNALDEVSFTINSGEIVAFLGPNGAGKSTMMKIITGFIPQTQGEVFVNNQKIDADAIEIRNQIGYLPENNPLYLDMYVKEYLLFIANLYKLDRPKEKVEMMIERTGLTRESHKKIAALSKGYRQRVGLAQALIHDPSVLILDEPTTGLDPNQIVEIRDLISEIGKEKTVMLSTHIMQEVEAICDKIIIINKGKLIANDTTEKVQKMIKQEYQQIEVEFSENISENLLLQINEINNVKNINNNTWIIESNKDIRSTIFDFAVKNNVQVLSMNLKEKSLEEVFQELTQ
jgi:ABC-2 type transport system ATP-binding protein